MSLLFFSASWQLCRRYAGDTTDPTVVVTLNLVWFYTSGKRKYNIPYRRLGDATRQETARFLNIRGRFIVSTKLHRVCWTLHTLPHFIMRSWKNL